MQDYMTWSTHVLYHQHSLLEKIWDMYFQALGDYKLWLVKAEPLKLFKNIYLLIQISYAQTRYGRSWVETTSGCQKFLPYQAKCPIRKTNKTSKISGCQLDWLLKGFPKAFKTAKVPVTSQPPNHDERHLNRQSLIQKTSVSTFSSYFHPCRQFLIYKIFTDLPL